MDAKKFVKECVRRGMCSIDEAKDYVKRFVKELYTDDDCIDAYRRYAWVSLPSFTSSNYTLWADYEF